MGGPWVRADDLGALSHRPAASARRYTGPAVATAGRCNAVDQDIDREHGHADLTLHRVDDRRPDRASDLRDAAVVIDHQPQRFDHALLTDCDHHPATPNDRTDTRRRLGNSPPRPGDEPVGHPHHAAALRQQHRPDHPQRARRGRQRRPRRGGVLTHRAHHVGDQPRGNRNLLACQPTQLTRDPFELMQGPPVPRTRRLVARGAQPRDRPRPARRARPTASCTATGQPRWPQLPPQPHRLPPARHAPDTTGPSPLQR